MRDLLKAGLIVLILLWGPAFLPADAFSLSGQGKKAAEPELVWPLPPEPPRIKYLMSLSSSQDVGAPRSWLRRIWRHLVGSEEERMVKPYGVVTSGDGRRVYVADTAARRVHRFDLQEGRYRQISETPEGRLLSPIGVALDRSERLYVSDSVLKRVYVYDREGRPRGVIGQGEELERPTGLAIDPREGRLYLADTLAHKVWVYDLRGKLRYAFGKRGSSPGEFNFPTNLFVDREGRVYVTDSMNFRVQMFDKRGQYLAGFGRLGDGVGDFSNPKGIAVDSQGHIYVVDALFDAVQIFDRQGRILLSFGSPGQGPGDFWLPAGLHIDPQDRIYVADSYNRRVQVFRFLGEAGK